MSSISYSVILNITRDLNISFGQCCEFFLDQPIQIDLPICGGTTYFEYKSFSSAILVQSKQFIKLIKSKKIFNHIVSFFGAPKTNDKKYCFVIKKNTFKFKPILLN